MSPCLSPLIILNLLISSPPGLPSHACALVLLLLFVVWLAFLLREYLLYTIQFRILFFFLLVPSPRCLNHSRIFTSQLYAATSKFIFQSGHFPTDWNDFHNYIPSISTWMTWMSHGPVQHVWIQNEHLSFDIGSPPDSPISINDTGLRTLKTFVGFLVAMGYNLNFVMMLTNLQDLTSTDCSSFIFLFIQVKLQLYSTSPCFSNTIFKFMSPCSWTCCSCCLDAIPFFFLNLGCYLDSAPISASEKAMAAHSSTLAWQIPWTEEPGRLQSMGSRRVGHDWTTSLSLFTFIHWRRKWQPTPVFLPGESQGWGGLVGCHLCGCTESDTTEAT